MGKKEDKKIITVQLPTDLYEQLLVEANNKMLTLSAYLRLLIIDRDEKNKAKN